MVTEEPPEFVRVSESVWEFPGCTLPKRRLEGFGLSVPVGKIPVPANATVRFGFDPSELRERFPLRLPLDGGVNLTVKVVLWPALRLIGRLRPVTPNPAPATVA